MPWKSIRLELACTDGFPNGSASRSYLLRLPLDDRALIDEAALALSPARATAYRYWPNERDKFGVVSRTGRGWAVRFEDGEECLLFGPDAHPLAECNLLTLGEPDGVRRPFRVVSIRPVT